MRTTTLIVSLMLVASSGSQADTRVFSAQLITFGQVFVNHAVLPSGTTIYEGDHIATEAATKALIMTPGRGRVEIRNSSEVVYAPHGIALRKGVAGTETVPVELDRYTVEPQRGNGKDPWIVVSRRGGRHLVAVYRGQAWIREKGVAPLLVSAGSFALQTPADADPASGDDAKPQPSKKEGAGAGAAGKVEPTTGGTAAANAGWTIGPLGHAASVALVTAVGAAAVGGAVAAVALTGDSPSPSQ
jgi:hypothetical protein